LASSLDPTDVASVWRAVVGLLEGKRALAWARKTALVELSASGGGAWEAVIEPMPGHGDLLGFATPARLAPVGVVLGQVMGGRASLTMRARRGEAAVARAGRDDAQTVDDLPLVRRMKEVFERDYNVRLIAQRRESAAIEVEALAEEEASSERDDG
jgi:hypothetical protein